MRIVSGITLILLLLSMLTLAFNIQHAESSEPPATDWSRTYGGTAGEEGECFVETVDGGYALAGRTYAFGAADFWLVKVDSSGNHEWNRTYGGGNGDVARSVVQTNDGGYALAGWTRSFGAGVEDFWLIKVDSSGNHEWNKTYGGTKADEAECVVQTSDGGYALAGYTWSSGIGQSDFWLIKTDSSGNVQYSKTYGGVDSDRAQCVVETDDGGYVLAGFGFANLVKTDAGGNMLWNKKYGGLAYSVVKTSDGGYALTGYHTVGLYDCDSWLVKVDSYGNMQWSKTYGGNEYDMAFSVVETSDGGYALAGDTESFSVGEVDVWLVKTDADGNIQWNKTFGGADADWARSVIQTEDGGYALAGTTYSFGAGGCDFWLIKIAPTTVAGDVNGNGTVDASDLFDLSKAYGCVPGDANWDGRCDFNEDNKVDILDVANLGKNYGKTV